MKISEGSSDVGSVKSCFIVGKTNIQKIKQTHKSSRELYGSPRITAALRLKGLSCNKKRVARIMRSNDIKAKTVRKYKATTNSKHKLPVAENLLN